MAGAIRWLFAGIFVIGCNQPSRAPVEPEPTKQTEHDSFFWPLASEPITGPRDLAAIRAQGELRVLVQRGELRALPRQDSPLAAAMASAELVASELGLSPRFIVDASRQALRQALKDGRGDLLLTPSPNLEPTGLAVTTPVRHVDEVVVATVGAKTIPTSWSELDGRAIHAAPWFASYSRLQKHSAVTIIPERLEPAEVLARVGVGQIPMAVAFSDDVAAYSAYRTDVAVAMVLAEDVPLVWAVNPEAPRLLEGINGAIFQSALTKHTRAAYGGDLKAIKKRQVIRVAMQNDAASYFLFRGQQVGFQFELAERLAHKLGVRLEVVVPDEPRDLLRLLRDRRCDLAVTAISEQLSQHMAFSRPFMFAEQLLVQAAADPPLGSLDQLAGKTIHVRRSSAYFELLLRLGSQIPGLTIATAPEDRATSELIAAVGQKQIPLTVANSVLLGAELTYRDDVQGTLVLASKSPLAYGLRHDSPRLRAWVNRFLAGEYRSTAYNLLYAKYFKNKKRMRLRAKEEVSMSGRLSPYDQLAREYGRRYGIDWRLVVAQMYQESRFDPQAESWVGARGLMQIMPRTGQELGFSPRALKNPRANIHAGVKYLAQMIARFDAAIPMRQRVRFGLAAYNAGLGHVLDARRLAARKGWERDRWFGHVEKAIRLLAKPKYARRARYGYCRGSEPADYVSRIQSRYDGYVRLVPAGGFAAGDSRSVP